MLASYGFGLIALFSVLSSLLGADRPRNLDVDQTFRYAGRLFR